jgi:adenylate cyclase
VKGKIRPVKIYELLGPVEDSERVLPLVRRFHTALEAYRGRHWQTALGLFGELLRDFPQDRPTRLFVERCQDLIERPPEGQWDGVYVMKSK